MRALWEHLFLSVTFSSDWFTCKFQTLESSHHHNDHSRDWVFCSTCLSPLHTYIYCLLRSLIIMLTFFLSLSMSNSINQCLFSQKAYICFSSFLLQVACSLPSSLFNWQTFSDVLMSKKQELTIYAKYLCSTECRYLNREEKARERKKTSSSCSSSL